MSGRGKGCTYGWEYKAYLVRLRSFGVKHAPDKTFKDSVLGKGYKVSIYEFDFKDRELIGENLRYSQEQLPHLETLLVNRSTAITQDVDLVVIGKPIPGILEHFDANMPIVNVHRLKGTV